MPLGCPETGPRRQSTALARNCSIAPRRGRLAGLCGDPRNLAVETMKPYNSKNRPSWAAPKRQYPTRSDPAPAFMVARSGFGDFTAPGRRQCRATAKHGDRCRRDAVQGCETCGTHGGLQAIGKRLARLGYSPSRPGRALRKALATLGAGDPPPGFPGTLSDLSHLSPLRRGELFEAWHNRESAPDEWRRMREWLSR